MHQNSRREIILQITENTESEQHYVNKDERKSKKEVTQKNEKLLEYKGMNTWTVTVV